MIQEQDLTVQENISEDIDLDESPASSSYTSGEFIRFLRDIVFILLVVLLIRWIIVTPFRINGSSMEESYHDREYILVDKFSYFNMKYIFYSSSQTGGVAGTIDWILSSTLAKIPLQVGNPHRGDVVVLTPHVDHTREYYIKRVIGIPGDTIKFQDGEVFIRPRDAIEFTKLNESYLSSLNRGQTFLPPYLDINIFTVPENAYWVMGDNRTNSADSRQCFKTCTNLENINAHFIARGDVIGKVLLSFGYFNILNTDTTGIHLGQLKWIYPPRLLSHPRSATYPELDAGVVSTGSFLSGTIKR